MPLSARGSWSARRNPLPSVTSYAVMRGVLPRRLPGGEDGSDRAGPPYAAGVRIAFGTDERTEVTDRIKAALAERGHDVAVVGEGDPWPDVGRRVGEAVAARRGRPGRRVLLDRHRRVDGRQQGSRGAGRAVHRPRDRGGRPPLERRQRARPRPAPDLAGAGRRDARRLPVDRPRGRRGAQHRQARRDPPAARRRVSLGRDGRHRPDTAQGAAGAVAVARPRAGAVGRRARGRRRHGRGGPRRLGRPADGRRRRAAPRPAGLQDPRLEAAHRGRARGAVRPHRRLVHGLGGRPRVGRGVRRVWA